MASIVEPRGPISFPEPTPMHNTDGLWLSLSASRAEMALPAIQPSDIEEIPGYELLGILGRGGMGIVFRARQISLKRQVALKMILTGRNARPSDRARFQKEAEAVARLQHANIVQIYEVGQQNGLPYISLEFVNAGSLAQFLGGAPQSPRDTAHIVLELAGAMHYAHKRGIVHRDLKPANILLQLDESSIVREGHGADPTVFQELRSYVPKISDFGLAKHMGGDEHLRQGALLGTPSYMAPEQAGGEGTVGPATDVYALGAVLYEMLTGRPPFRGTSVQETAHQVLTQDPVLPTQLQPKIPSDLETICLTCLSKDPATRYASAEALGEDLRRFLDDKPILAPPVALPDRVMQWARGRPAMTACLALALLVTGGLLHAWGELTYALRDERDQAKADRAAAAVQLEQAMHTIDALAGDAAPEQRRPALATAVDFYQALATAHRDRSGMRHIAAHACRRRGELQQQLGETAAAAVSFREAVELYTELGDTEQANRCRALLERSPG